MNLCKYKDALGIPKQGVHSFRIFNFAVFDILATLVAAYIFSYVYKIKFVYTSIALFTLGIILHRLFCVRTTLDKIIFPNVKS